MECRQRDVEDHVVVNAEIVNDFSVRLFGLFFFVFCLFIVFSITIRALAASSCLCFVHLLLLCRLRQDEGLWDDGSVTLAQLNKAEMNEILSKAQGMSTSQLRSEINKLEGASSRTTSLASSAARTQSLGGIVRGGQITEVSSRAGCRQRCRLSRLQAAVWSEKACEPQRG